MLDVKKQTTCYMIYFQEVYSCDIRGSCSLRWMLDFTKKTKSTEAERQQAAFFFVEA